MVIPHRAHAPIITGAGALVIFKPLLLNFEQVPLDFSECLISLAGVVPPGLLVVGVFLSVRGLSSMGSAPPMKLPGSLAPIS